MHPCCWGNFFQMLAPLLPILAVLAIAGRKVFAKMGLSVLVMRKQKAPSAKSCCSVKSQARQAPEQAT